MRFARLTIALAAVTMLGAACGGGDDGGGTGGPIDRLSMVDNSFEPSDFTVTAGTQLTVANDGEALHSFTVEEQDISVDVQPGEEATVDVSIETGSHPYVCEYHPEMTGTMTVE